MWRKPRRSTGLALTGFRAGRHSPEIAVPQASAARRKLRAAGAVAKKRNMQPGTQRASREKRKVPLTGAVAIHEPRKSARGSGAGTSSHALKLPRCACLAAHAGDAMGSRLSVEVRLPVWTRASCQLLLRLALGLLRGAWRALAAWAVHLASCCASQTTQRCSRPAPQGRSMLARCSTCARASARATSCAGRQPHRRAGCSSLPE